MGKNANSDGVKKKEKGSVGKFFSWLGNDLKEIGLTFTEGDWKSRVSYLIMGFGPIMRKQFLRGFAFLAIEVLFVLYMVGFGWNYLKDIITLGTAARVLNDNGTYTYNDNSFFILLYSILTIIIIFAFILVWRMNLRENRNEEKLLKEGKALPTVKQDLHSLLDSNFDKTLLTLPVLGVFVFTVLPIIFMICIAFTDYDKNHQPPTNLFSWVGLENFKNLVNFGSSSAGASTFGSTFLIVLSWTLIWAFFATFLTYFCGMGVAILINKKGIKFKKLWRTILVMTIAVPQFVSLLYVGKMFANDGLINSYLMKWGWISERIPFWSDPVLSKIAIIVVNLWVGIPYTMLIMTGLLMNIPEDLYESARIDGANGFQMFKSITLPYMFFVTGPFLLTQFTGNINNFNIIYLLNQGGPTSLSLTNKAGYTDLLVTWLYKMTVNDTNYRMAAVLGIAVFVVVAGISLVVYNMLPSVKDEEGFQ